MQNESAQPQKEAVRFYFIYVYFSRACFYKLFGRPPNWVSHERTVHWTVLSPVLIFVRQKVFRALRSSTKGSALGFRRL